METTTTTTIAQLDGLRLSDWIESRNLSRSTGYELLKLLQIEPEARRVPTSRKPVSHLSPEQIEMLDPFATEINRGATLPQLRERLGQSAIVPNDHPGQSAIVPDAANGKITTINPDHLLALVQALQPQQQADPLRIARGLTEAASLGVALSSAELADLLGMAASTVRDWPDGHSPRPGFVLHRSKVGAVWWTVDRLGQSATVSDNRSTTSRSSTDRRVGFDVAAYLAPAPVVDVTHQTVGERLFVTNRIG